MENKKIDVLFGLVVIAFLVVSIILINDFKAQRVNDIKEYKAVVANIVRMKNDRIRLLYTQLVMVEKENEDLKNTLAQTRNALDALSRKLIQPVLSAVPANAPAPVAAVK